MVDDGQTNLFCLLQSENQLELKEEAEIDS